jgi:hypothetical protein
LSAGQKKCSKCGEVKPLEGFCKDRWNKDGRKSNCRECAKAMTRKWRKANPEKMREQNRRWRAANPERCRGIDRKKYATDPEKVKICVRRARKKMQSRNYARLIEMFGPACLDCDREYPMPIYDYHHLDPSTKKGNLMVGHWKWERVKAYVEIGVVQLCPTCHRLRHFTERELAGVVKCC